MVLHSVSFYGPYVRGLCPDYPWSFYLGNGEYPAEFFHIGIHWIDTPLQDLLK